MQQRIETQERWSVQRVSPRPSKYKILYYCSLSEAMHMAQKLTTLTNVKHITQHHPWTGQFEGDYIFPAGDMILREKAAGWRYVFENGRVPLTSIWPTYSGEKTSTYRINTDILDEETKKRLATSLAIRWKIKMDAALQLIAQGCTINEKYGTAIEFQDDRVETREVTRIMVIRL